MSRGFRSSILSTSIPSTTNKGLEPPSLKVDVPRIRKVELLPGSEEVIISSPEILPCKAVLRSIGCEDSISLALTETIAPVISLFFMEPYPTTTTSSRFCVISCRVTSLCREPFTSIVTGLYPIQEITICALGAAVIEKRPSRSVVSPVLVPFTTILAPGTGPSLSETTPVIVIF